MALPLSLVRARLKLFKFEDRRDIACVAISCKVVLEEDDVAEATALVEDYSYLRDYNSLNEDSQKLRRLAVLLLCPGHNGALGEKAARAWGEGLVDNDLIQLFRLDRNPCNWTCLAEQCITCIGQCWEILDIMETITSRAVVRECLRDDETETLVGELVKLLHCDEHRITDRVKQISEEWIKALTMMIQQRTSEDNFWKELPRKKRRSNDAVDQLRIRQQVSGTELFRGTSCKALFGSGSDSDACESSSSLSKGKVSPDAKLITPSNSNSRRSSSRNTPESIAQQTNSSSRRAKRRLASTADEPEGRSSSTGRTGSPFSKLPALNPAKRGGIAVTDNLGNSSPTTQRIDVARSHSSSDIGISYPQPHDNRPTHLRDTQSYPTLPIEGRTEGADSERGNLIPTLHPSISIQAQEEGALATDTKTTKPREIDNLLLDYIKSGPLAKSERKDRYIYVLRSKEREGQVKIGRTDSSVDARMAYIRNKCRFKHLESVYDGEQVALPNLQRLEKLCHTELKSFKKNYLCKTCKNGGVPQEHEEWYEVPSEIAIQTVQKWRTWLSLSPYDKDGLLKPLWRERIGPGLFGRKLFGGEEETIHDHYIRHQRWSSWLKEPSLLERMAFEVWTFFFEERVAWQSSAIKVPTKRMSRWDVAQESYLRLVIYLLTLWIICEPWQRTILSPLLLLVL